REHLKEGHIVISRINTRNGPVDYVTSFNYFHETGLSGTNWVCLDNDTPEIITGKGSFDNFLRYPTPEEIALLNGEAKNKEPGKVYPAIGLVIDPPSGPRPLPVAKPTRTIRKIEIAEFIGIPVEQLEIID